MNREMLMLVEAISREKSVELDVVFGAVEAALAQAVSLGYYRGILNTLDDIERSQPAHSAFVGAMRQLAQQFQFDAMGQILEQAPS